MIKRESINFDIGFSDGEVVSYNRKDEILSITVQAWNEQKILIICNDIIGFLDKGGWDISDFCEVKSETKFLKEVLDRQFEKIPDNHGYKVYQFVDNDDQVVIEIVCSEVKMSVQ